MITVALDSAGAAAAGEWIRAAQPTHPALIDAHYDLATRYHLVNVPSAVWIDERGRIARPAEVAFADNRFIAYTKFDMTRYLDAIRDWVAKGSASGHVRPPAGRRERLSLPTAAHAQAAACFRLAEHLHAAGARGGRGAVLQGGAAPRARVVVLQAAGLGADRRGAVLFHHLPGRGEGPGRATVLSPSRLSPRAFPPTLPKKRAEP